MADGTRPCSMIVTSTASTIRHCVSVGSLPSACNSRSWVKLYFPMRSPTRSLFRTRMLSASKVQMAVVARGFESALFMVAILCSGLVVRRESGSETIPQVAPTGALGPVIEFSHIEVDFDMRKL